MTYKEYINSFTERFGLNSKDVEIILLNQSTLIPDADADVDVKIAKTALCNEFASLIPLKNISEGGLSLSWNLDAIKLWYKSTCNELGITDVSNKPAIHNKSNIW